MCQDPGPLPGGNTMPTGVPNFPARCGRISNGEVDFYLPIDFSAGGRINGLFGKWGTEGRRLLGARGRVVASYNPWDGDLRD